MLVSVTLMKHNTEEDPISLSSFFSDFALKEIVKNNRKVFVLICKALFVFGASLNLQTIN